MPTARLARVLDHLQPVPQLARGSAPEFEALFSIDPVAHPIFCSRRESFQAEKNEPFGRCFKEHYPNTPGEVKGKARNFYPWFYLGMVQPSPTISYVRQFRTSEKGFPLDWPGPF